jgi:hypothetical protein
MYSNLYVPKDLNYYIIVTHAICELSLRHQYFFSNAVEDLRYHFRDRTIVEIFRLSVAQQPQQLAQAFTQAGLRPNMAMVAGFMPPTDSTWRYYDKEMLEVLKGRYPELAEKLQG